MNRIDRYLANISEDAKDQIIKFLLDKNSANSVEFINKCIDEFSILYPGDVR